MNCKAMILSDSLVHRVVFLQDKVLLAENGSKSLAEVMTHREIPAPTRDAAVKAAKSIGTDLSRETFAETGAKVSAGSLTVVGTFGAPPSLPKAK